MKKWLFGNVDKAKEQGYIWNLIASGINASEAVLVLLVAARVVGINETGILTMAFTIANLLMCIGKYGVRNFQVTDVAEKYSFKDYYFARLISEGTLFVVLCSYLAYGGKFLGYPMEKIIIIGVVTLMYGIEAFEDVYLAEFQRRGRLDIGSKMFSVRWSITILCWCLGLILTRNAVLATIIAFCVGGITEIILLCIIKAETDKWVTCDNAGSKGIFVNCFPLFLSSIMAMYLPNAAKYAIDRVLGDGEQAIYGFISMPIFVVSLFATVIFQPVLVNLSNLWKDKEISAFRRKVVHMSGIIFLISIVVMVIGYLIGIPALSLLYGVDLANYKFEFIVLLLGGVALAYVGLYGTILTIIRRQSLYMWEYLIVSIFLVCTIQRFVSKYGLIGAASYNAFMIGVLSLVLMISVGTSIVKGERSEKN